MSTCGMRGSGRAHAVGRHLWWRRSWPCWASEGCDVEKMGCEQRRGGSARKKYKTLACRKVVGRDGSGGERALRVLVR